MKLIIADDHTLFRDALTHYIMRSETNAHVKTAKSFDGAMEFMEQDAQQDLVILDLRMPGMNGLNGLEEFKDKYPSVPVALMSGLAEADDVKDAFEKGVIGYFPKTLSGKALLQAIKLVMTGERFMPLDHDHNVVMPSYFADEGAAEAGAHKPLMLDEEVFIEKVREDYKLTPREAEVLCYLARGASNKEIANTLDLQVVTIKLHVRGICQKLNVQNRTQAAIKANEYGHVVTKE